jgi:hypothetical protein
LQAQAVRFLPVAEAFADDLLFFYCDADSFSYNLRELGAPSHPFC